MLIRQTSFGFYGLLRKQVSVPAAIGLWVETMLMLPIAGLFFVWLVNSDGLRPSVEIAQLALGGVISVVPLVLFAAAALRLSLTALGFVQYLAPSCALMLAVFLNVAADSAISAPVKRIAVARMVEGSKVSWACMVPECCGVCREVSPVE